MSDTKATAIQDEYPAEFAYCYGYGRLNKEGHQFRTIWQGEKLILNTNRAMNTQLFQGLYMEELSPLLSIAMEQAQLLWRCIAKSVSNQELEKNLHVL